MIIVVLLLAPAAVFGLTYIIRYTDGPLDVFAAVRRLLGHKEGGENYKLFAKLIDCFWCMSTWVSAIISALVMYNYGGTFIEWIVLWFAGVGISNMLHVLYMNAYEA